MPFFSWLKSQLVNFWAFKPFFPFVRTARDAAVFPVDYYLGDGRSRAFPSIINLNVTTVCNLHCPFCFNDRILGKREEMSTDQMIALIDQLSRRRTGLFITGGEPFARKDIYEIIEEAKRRGMPVGVVTNGTLLTEENVKRLRDIGLDVVVISYHGTREAHDEAVGQQGAFDKTMRTLDWFREYWPAPGPMINYILTEKSIPRLGDFLSDMEGKKNVVCRLSHLNFITPKEAEEHARYWKEEFGDDPVELLHYVYEPSDRLYEPIIDALERHKDVFTKPILNKEEMKSWYSPDFDLKRRCVFIWRSTYINSDGDVYPCQFFYLKMGNIKEQTLEEIWNGERYRRFRALLRKGLTPGCSRCCKL